MISAISMKEVRRKVSSAYFEDGLWDVLLGLFVMLIPVYITTRPIFILPFVLSLICCVAGYFVVEKVRRQITYPRIGYSKITNGRSVPIIIWMSLILALVFVGFAVPIIMVITFYGLGTWLLSFLIYLRIVVFAAIITFVAYRYGAKRWYLYAFWIFIWLSFGPGLFSLAVDTPNNPYWPINYTFYIAGGAILLVGMVVFVRFLCNNPVMVEEELDEQTQNG